MKKVDYVTALGLAAATMLLTVLLLGCATEDTAAVEAVAKSYYDAIRHKNYDQALSYCSPLYFKNPPRTEDEARFLADINAKLGDLDSYEKLGWEASRRTWKQDIGTLYEFGYHVKYAKGEAVETVRLFKLDHETTARIVAYDVTSNALIMQ